MQWGLQTFGNLQELEDDPLKICHLLDNHLQETKVQIEEMRAIYE
jgi:hypothetical protein